MSLMQAVKKMIFPNTYSSEAYKSFLRRNGVEIGEHTVIYSPNHTLIDVNKMYMVSIGDYCRITAGVTVLAHDYSRSVSGMVYGEYVGGMLPVKIGNNVFIGQHATILMGTTIGDNCIIGANSLVKGTFPDNVVIAGNPAKIVCTLEEYHQRGKNRWVDDAKKCAETIYARTGRVPTIEEMTDSFFGLYMPHTQETVDKYRYIFNRTADDTEKTIKDFLASKPVYESFEDFLSDCSFS